MTCFYTKKYLLFLIYRKITLEHICQSCTKTIFYSQINMFWTSQNTTCSIFPNSVRREVRNSDESGGDCTSKELEF